MIDEYVDRLVDRWCQTVPAAVKPRLILMQNSPPGWRLKLYFGTAAGKIGAAFGHISNEDNMDLFLRETAERGDDSFARVMQRLQGVADALLRTQGCSLRFAGTLFLMMLSALGVLAVGGRLMGATAASLGVLWLSAAIENGYAPIAGGVRQRYLASTLLRTCAIALMMLGYFFGYAAQGVASNVVLQSAMLITLTVHAVLFLSMVMLNTRQPLLLRVLAGVTGVLPALTAASAVALAATCLFRPWPLPLSGAACALGAVMAFLGDELITITHLGGIRLKYHSIWVCLLMTGGFTLMLLGAWTYAPIG